MAVTWSQLHNAWYTAQNGGHLVIVTPCLALPARGGEISTVVLPIYLKHAGTNQYNIVYFVRMNNDKALYTADVPDTWSGWTSFLYKAYKRCVNNISDRLMK